MKVVDTSIGRVVLVWANDPRIVNCTMQSIIERHTATTAILLEDREDSELVTLEEIEIHIAVLQKAKGVTSQ